MNYLRQVIVGTVLMAAAAGCGDNGPLLDEPGQIDMRITTLPSDVAAIRVTVTAIDFTADVHQDLQESGGSWSGIVPNVPPGLDRTVTAFAYDDAENLIYEGATRNVTVLSGKLISVDIHLLPYPNDPGGTGIDTPPHFVDLEHADAIDNNATTAFTAVALDPDNNTLLTYTWSATPGGTFSDNDVDGDGIGNIVSNQVSGNPVVVEYTPPTDFTGIAIIQVSVSDGQATATTTFPIAVGSGVVPSIQFDVLPDLAITSVDRQVLMPNGSTAINYTLTNPGNAWSVDPIHVHTSWTDTCGGQFTSTDSDDVDIATNVPANRSVTYTASADVPLGVTSCGLRLSVVDDFGASMWSGVIVWIEEPLTVFVSSGEIDGAVFAGQSDAADGFCQYYASTAGVPQGIYKALLSFDEISAKDRIVDGPYVLPGGTPVARSKAELFSGNLLNSIQIDENGQPVEGNVFTGTDPDGSASARCANWTSNNPLDSATGGVTLATDGDWTAFGQFACDQPAHVYCFQQAHERG